MTLIPNPYAGPARAIRESGGTVLGMGAVGDGQFLKRVGTDIVGAAAGGGAVPIEAAFISSSALTNAFATFGGVPSYTSGTGVSTGNLRARPIVFGRDCTLTSIGLICATGVANAKARCGLYEAGADGYPATLVAESAELDCSTNGRKLTTGLSVAISASKAYWFVAIGGTAAPNLVASSGLPGLNTIVAASGATSGAVTMLISVAQAYGALPSTYPSGAATVSNALLMPIALCGVS